MTNNFQINTVYLDLLSKVHYQNKSFFTNQKSKKSKKHFVTIGNIQYLFRNYLSFLPINKKMYKLLFILFIIKLYAQVNIF